MIPRLGERVTPGARYRRRPGIYAVLPRGRDVLLTYQGDPHFEFQLPGGGIDAGEQPITALHREVLEETGWRISEPRHLGTFRRFTYMPEYQLLAEKVCHIFVARPILQLAEPTEPDHIAVWLPIREAVGQVANPIDAEALDRVMD